MFNRTPNMNKIPTQTDSDLTIFFYLTHVKREEIGPLIQFLQKLNLNFRRIKNEKQTRASNFLRQNSNFMAQSSKPITFEEFRMISQFLNTQTIVVGFEYGNTIWNVSRTKMQFLPHPTDST
jgi:TPP-dependent 2-oxoacid decarboxylase